MAQQEMVKREESTPASREETRSAGKIMVPAVDIYETDEALTLVADMPGVGKEGLDINLEKGVLTLNGEVGLRGHGTPLLREFSSANYYRQFKLSEHIDAEKAAAELNNGVLTLTIPKAESAKPRRIEIRH
jgi:HSP20 family molecular chaperone IbpA